MQVNIVLLAAGKGERFQASSPRKVGCANIKQLAPLNGLPLINHCINQLTPLVELPHTNTLYVTLGANKNAIQSAIPQGISIIASQHWSQGMGHTLAESVQSINAHSSHVLIALADQVLITTEHYQALLTASIKQPNKIIASLCNGRLMAPAIFPDKYFGELIKLQGDKGASKLLQQHARQADAISCENAKFDIDSHADLEQVSRHLHETQKDSLRVE